MKGYLVITLAISACISSAVSRSISSYDDYEAEFLQSYSGNHDFESDVYKVERYGDYPKVDISRQIFNGHEGDISSFVNFVPLKGELEIDNNDGSTSDESTEGPNDDNTNDDDNDNSDEVDYNGNVTDDETSNKSSEETDNEDDKDLSQDTTTAESESDENMHTIIPVLDDRGILLQKLSSSHLNSGLLTSAYADNIMDLRAVFEGTETGLWSLLGQNINVYEGFYTTAYERRDYDGEKHRKLMTEISEMLAKVDEVRMQILKMQGVAQRLNYHQLLKALLKEIYGEDKVKL